VGGLVGPAKGFLIPRELLLRRSRRFRNLLERQAGELSSKVIPLPDTPVQTMEAFFMWTFSPQPQIDERATFSEVVRLGIFAWQYQISALSNQVTDIIRSNLANGQWHLQASMVDEIYEAVPTGRPLREVIRAALGGLPRSSVEGEGRTREEWKATFLKHAELGWDCYEAGGSEWTPRDYLSGACRFHHHQGESHQEELSVFVDQCVYAREECFPRWEEESIKGQKDEVGSEEWRAVVQERDGEQERCGADEERKEGKLSIEAVVDEAEEPVATVATEAVEAVVNGVATEATEAVEAVVDDVATEAVVNGVETEAVETEAVEAVVNGEATEAVVSDMATEAAVNGEATEAAANGEAMEATVSVMATESVVSDQATEAAVDDQAMESVISDTATEAVVDGAKGPAAMEALVIITKETVTEKTAMELKNGKPGGKPKRKKKGGK
jgi:hypothetical protein